mgnify:CR=1 FL=1
MSCAALHVPFQCCVVCACCSYKHIFRMQRGYSFSSCQVVACFDKHLDASVSLLCGVVVFLFLLLSLSLHPPCACVTEMCAESVCDHPFAQAPTPPLGSCFGGHQRSVSCTARPGDHSVRAPQTHRKSSLEHACASRLLP